jgi:hypothetical protein
MISNEIIWVIIWVLTFNKMTENPLNRPEVNDTSSRSATQFKIVPTAESLNHKGSIYKKTSKARKTSKSSEIGEKSKCCMKRLGFWSKKC